jgi:hypothetical protein
MVVPWSWRGGWWTSLLLLSPIFVNKLSHGKMVVSAEVGVTMNMLTVWAAGAWCVMSVQSLFFIVELSHDNGVFSAKVGVKSDMPTA